jgi:hypothetical protein
MQTQIRVSGGSGRSVKIDRQRYSLKVYITKGVLAFEGTDVSRKKMGVKVVRWGAHFGVGEPGVENDSRCF